MATATVNTMNYDRAPGPYQDQLVECALVDLAVFQVPLANVGCNVVIGTLKIGVVPVVGAVLDDLGQDGPRDVWKWHGYKLRRQSTKQDEVRNCG